MTGKRVVWKYRVQPGMFPLTLPAGAKVLSVAAQHDDIYLWALVNPKAKLTETRMFVTLPTGTPVEFGNRDIISTTGVPAQLSDQRQLNFLGTVHFEPAQRLSLRLVFHVFEVPKEE